MESYKDFANFLDYVKANKLFEIKLELMSIIVLLRGDCLKINDAIEYARANSDFDFEIHQLSQPNIPLDSNEDKFVYEKGKLLTNFSKERLEEVFRLYPLMCEEKGIVNEPDPEVITDSNNNIIKKIAIASVVAVGAYLLCQLLK